MVDVEFARAEFEVGGGEQVEDGAVAMPEHWDELDDEDAGEEDEEGEAERLEAEGLVVEARYRHVDVVADLVLDELQVEYDDHPEGVDHEEGEAGVVPEGLEVAGHFGLVVLVLDKRVQVPVILHKQTSVIVIIYFKFIKTMII